VVLAHKFPQSNFTFISNEDVKIGNFLGITGVSYASGSIVVPSTGVISRFRITALSTGSIFNNYKIRFWLSKNQTCATFEPYKDTVKSGLVMELSGRNFFNEPKTVTLQDRSGNGNNGTASGFQYRTQEYADKLSDFAGKVTGSFVENPNKAKVTISSALPTPSQTWGEISTAEYTKINSLNAVSYASGNTIVSGMMALQLFSFNLIEIFERQYGMMPCVDQSLAGKVAWLKANISNLDCSWHGYGSCPTGNKATFTKWNAESSIWSTTVASHNYNTVSLLTQHMVQPYLTSVITNDGFAHYLAYTDASDGVTASTIYTDYISLTLKFKPAGGSDGSGGIKFDGVDDKITVNHLIPAKPFTISSWVYTTSTDAQCLYCNRLSAGAGIAIFRLSASGGIRFDTGGQQWTFAYVLPLNTWVHLTFQISDSEKKLFVNGILHSSIAFTDPITNTSSVVATIGVAHINGASFEYYFKGTLDRFTIYNRALSASEVYQNYFAGVNLNVPSPTDASPVVSNLPANTYKITLPNAEIYEFTLPEELRGIGTEVDKVTFDRVSKKGFVERRIKVFVADGTKTYATLNPLTLSKEARCTTLNDNKGQFILSTKFKMVANTWDKDDLYTCSNAGVSYTQIAYRIPINDDATTFFTNNPTTTYYATNVPTCTPLTFTKVTTSTATEVPMAFLTNVPDPLHPAQIVSNLPAN